MKAKWYLGTVIFIFTLLGVVNNNQIPEANQEIVLKFTHLKVSTNEAEKTIDFVKKQLQAIGVENIQVEKQASGALKITYFSTTNAEGVKKILQETALLSLENPVSHAHKKPSECPLQNETSTYNLDVFEISKEQPNSDFGGTCALEIKQDYNRFYIPVVIIPTKNTVLNSIALLELETCKFQNHVALAITNTPHSIPEVRAGPAC